MASKGILAAKQAQAAADQAKFLALVNAKLDVLLKANKLAFDEAAFFGEAPAVEEAAPEGDGLADNPPAPTGQDESTQVDGVAATEAPTSSKKK